ncbi:class I SAM-dependent methyltransferase [Rummeliibacillus pycnus]|uniref:class I SAM-dependent methyltransferase n=1 Tax=Rummeliibacillus pycnus TaxID=101070 RepID=UPI003D289CB9
MYEVKTIVTTAGRPDDESLQLAEIACHSLQVPFVERRKRSIKKIAELAHANVIVAGKHRFEYYPLGTKEAFFFHPSSAAFRLKRVARGEHDPLLDAVQLKDGDSFIDCTLGIGSDSMLAAFAVGQSGKVVGCEGNQNVAFIVKEGMKRYDISQLPLLKCMERITVIPSLAIDFLKQQPDHSFDVVYMDPMFEETIEESINFAPLRNAGLHDSLNDEWINEAKRVARKRVVLKAHYRSPLFEQFHFKRDIRQAAKFHYGIIEIEE